METGDMRQSPLYRGLGLDSWQIIRPADQHSLEQEKCLPLTTRDSKLINSNNNHYIPQTSYSIQCQNAQKVRIKFHLHLIQINLKNPLAILIQIMCTLSSAGLTSYSLRFFIYWSEALARVSLFSEDKSLDKCNFCIKRNRLRRIPRQQ